MMLGFLCGVVYALTNGVLIFVIQLVVNLIFGGNTADSVAQRLEKAPSFAGRSWTKSSPGCRR
jgi:hypothetical protein